MLYISGCLAALHFPLKRKPEQSRVTNQIMATVPVLIPKRRGIRRWSCWCSFLELMMPMRG